MWVSATLPALLQGAGCDLLLGKILKQLTCTAMGVGAEADIYAFGGVAVLVETI